MCSNVFSTRKRRVPPIIVLVLTCLLPVTSALPLSQFFPFNATHGDKATEATDDGGSGRVLLNISFPFFNKSHNKLFVNNNGVISFLKELKTYKPEDFPLKDETPIIAPFWADVDVTIGGTVFYRESDDPAILAKATNEITQYFHSYQRFRATWVFIATWDNVGFYGASEQGKTKRNTFQAVLITDGVRSFVIFNYNRIEWTTGSNSGGSINDGTGGEPAQAGFNAGDGKTFREIPGARTDAVVNLTLTTNVAKPGKWVFEVDSETITGRCSETGSGELFVNKGSGSMLGGEKIEISGPCFSDTDSPVARFDDLNVTFPCIVNSDTDSAVCVTPTVFRTGNLKLSISVNDSAWNFTGHYTTVNIAEVEPLVHRYNPEQWIVGENNNLEISWETTLTNSTEVMVEVLGYTEEDGIPHLVPVLNITSVTTNGRARFKLSEMPRSVSSAIVKVSSSLNYSESLKMSIWSDVFPVRWSQGSFSDNWCSAWVQREAREPALNHSEACPCIYQQAESDTGRYQADPFCNYGDASSNINCIYRAQTKKCLMQNYQNNELGSQVCCYSDDNELLDARSSTGGGTENRYHFKSQGENVTAFFTYFEEDILPYLHCCKYSTDENLCTEFLRLRPPTSCQGYAPPAVGQAAGDPHIITLDGLSFTFNGEGEFVLVEDVSGSVMVQVRAERATDSEGRRQNATVFTAVAMQIKNVSDVVEIQLDEETVVKILVNGVELLEPTSDLNGLKIKKQIGNSSVEVDVVLEPVGMSFLLQITKYLINIMPTVGSPALKGKLRGLLGNYNGVANDDFIARNGTVLSHNATMKDIHFKFGLTWAVSENERLFSKNGRGSFDDTKDNSTFVPFFIDSVANVTLRNGTREVCGYNIQCIFDYQVTGNADIAGSTKKFTNLYIERVNSIKPVIRCPYLPEIENGNRTMTGQSEGSVAKYVCDPGFELLGAEKLICTNKDGEGKWSSPQPACAKKVTPPNVSIWNTTTIIMVAGGGGGGFLLFVGILVILVVRGRRKKHLKLNRKKIDQGSIEEVDLPTIFPTTNIPGPVFENPLFINSLQKLGDGGSYRIPRPTYVDPSIFSEFF